MNCDIHYCYFFNTRKPWLVFHSSSRLASRVLTWLAVFWGFVLPHKVLLLLGCAGFSKVQMGHWQGAGTGREGWSSFLLLLFPGGLVVFETGSHYVDQDGLEFMEACLCLPRTRHHLRSLFLLHQTEKLTRREVEAKFCNLSLSSNSVSTFWCVLHCLFILWCQEMSPRFCSSVVTSNTHLLLTDAAFPLECWCHGNRWD